MLWFVLATDMLMISMYLTDGTFILDELDDTKREMFRGFAIDSTIVVCMPVFESLYETIKWTMKRNDE